MNAIPPLSAAVHVPVLMREVLQMLALAPGLTVVDGTVGAGGHSRKIAEQLGPSGRLIGLDRDPMMLDHARRALTGEGMANAATVSLHQSTYANLPTILRELNIPAVDRILLDLGLSSDQLADTQRGFSFQTDGPLDLRFDLSQGVSAADWLLSIEESELARVLRDYGEESFADRIAAHLVKQRSRQPIRTARELADAVLAALPVQRVQQAEKHPATRVFQAVRIAVNQELEQVERALAETLPASLIAGGRLAVITFHSLEDRLVKQAFKQRDIWGNLTDKPLVATAAEQRFNPRSRSAKLRVAVRKPVDVQ